MHVFPCYGLQMQSKLTLYPVTQQTLHGSTGPWGWHMKGGERSLSGIYWSIKLLITLCRMRKNSGTLIMVLQELGRLGYGRDLENTCNPLYGYMESHFSALRVGLVG